MSQIDWKCRSICFTAEQLIWLEKEKRKSGKPVSTFIRDLINEKMKNNG